MVNASPLLSSAGAGRPETTRTANAIAATRDACTVCTARTPLPNDMRFQLSNLNMPHGVVQRHRAAAEPPVGSWQQNWDDDIGGHGKWSGCPGNNCTVRRRLAGPLGLLRG